MLPHLMATVKNPFNMSIRTTMEGRGKGYEVHLGDESCDRDIHTTSAIIFLEKFSEIMTRLHADSSEPLLAGSIMSLVLSEVLEGA